MFRFGKNATLIERSGAHRLPARKVRGQCSGFMGIFRCGTCRAWFKKDYSKAKYCNHKCAGLAAAGFRRPRIYTDEALIKMLRSMAKKRGRTPGKRDNCGADERIFRERFGSWNNAVVAAGLKPNSCGQHMTRRSEIKVSLRFKVLKRDGFRCVYCGGTPDRGYELHVDHVIPGGPATEDNLVTACWECNLGKSDKPL